MTNDHGGNDGESFSPGVSDPGDNSDEQNGAV